MELKVGGIYQTYRDACQHVSDYFVILEKTKDVYFGYRVLESESNIISRKDIQEELMIQSIQKRNFFFDGKEIIEQIIDGYLGIIENVNFQILQKELQESGLIEFEKEMNTM